MPTCIPDSLAGGPEAAGLEAADEVAGLPAGLLEAMTEPGALLAPDGTVLAANARWLSLEGTTLPEPPGGSEAERPPGRIAPTAEAIAELLSWRHDELTLALEGPPIPREARRRLRLRRLESSRGLLVLAVIESSGPRLWRELGVRTEHLDAVTEAMTAFLPSGDFGASAAILLRSAMIRTSSPSGFVATCSDGGLLGVVASEGVAFPNPAGRLGRDAFAGAFARRAPVAWIDGMGGAGVDCAVMRRLGFARALLVPILRGDEPLGLLAVGNGPEVGEAATASDIEVLVRVAGVLLDAARRREHAADLERQLRAAQRIESVGRLAGGIAHDFNNMLTVVLGLAGMIRATLDEAHPHARLVDEITAAGQRAAGLTRQLLAFSRRHVLQPELMSLNAAVTAMQPLLQRLLQEDVEIEMRLQPGLGHVVADVSQLEQVLMNLVVNARDAMPGGGRLIIETKDVVLDDAFTRRHVGARQGPHVLLSVSDTGIGMDAATRARVFEPFFTTKPPTTGTGLGLSTVYGIVKQSGGSVWADGEPGKGSTFTVYLPRAQDRAKPRPEVKAVEAPGAGGGERVLVVEDEPALRSLVVTALRSRGHVVIEAGDGEHALVELAGLGDARVDLVLTDLVMPGMGGAELASRVAALQPGVRILFMSGYSESAAGGLAAGAALVEKPFTVPALLREVRRAIEGGAAGAERGA